MVQYSFVLASASLRRRELLQAAGYNFEVDTGDFDEDSLPRDLPPAQFARQAALAKALDVARRRPTDLILAADTIVDAHGRVIGKPRDKDHAERITRILFAAPHKVITAVALVRLSDGLEILEHDTTTVHPRPMTESQVAEHLAGGSWEGKAGAYAVQETGDQFVQRMEGSYTNVVGLPMELLARMLEEAGLSGPR